MAARRTGGAVCVDFFVDLSVISCMGFGLKTIPCAYSVLPYDLWTVGGIKGLISITRNITTFIKVEIRESFFIKSAVTKKEAADMRHKYRVEKKLRAL